MAAFLLNSLLGPGDVLPEFSGGDAGQDGVGPGIAPRQQGAGPNNAAVGNPGALENGSLGADPDMLADGNGSGGVEAPAGFQVQKTVGVAGAQMNRTGEQTVRADGDLQNQ